MQTRRNPMSDDASNNAGKVLIVEDNQGLADLMAAWLRDEYPVEVAYNRYFPTGISSGAEASL